jgi:hypothetical protein
VKNKAKGLYLGSSNKKQNKTKQKSSSFVVQQHVHEQPFELRFALWPGCAPLHLDFN